MVVVLVGPPILGLSLPAPGLMMGFVRPGLGLATPRPLFGDVFCGSTFSWAGVADEAVCSAGALTAKQRMNDYDGY